MPIEEYGPGTAFPGVIGRTTDESSPAWPRAIYHVYAPDPLPAGRHELRFEFEPTGKPDIAHGKGAPGRAHPVAQRGLADGR